MSAESGWAERLGLRLGRLWRGYRRREARLGCWMQSQGLSVELARASLLIAKILLLGVLAYSALWMFLIVVVIVVAWGQGREGVSSKSESEWRDGPHGFGYYDGNGTRVDPYDPDDLDSGSF